MTPFRAIAQTMRRGPMESTVILALWAAATVLVVWLAAASLVRTRWARRAARATGETRSDVPEPTPEELMEARSMGLLPPER